MDGAASQKKSSKEGDGWCGVVRVPMGNALVKQHWYARRMQDGKVKTYVHAYCSIFSEEDDQKDSKLKRRLQVDRFREVSAACRSDEITGGCWTLLKSLLGS